MSKPSKSTVTRELPDEGTHSAVCKIIADLGTQESKNKDWADRRIILLLFELVDLSAKDKTVYLHMRLTFTEKSKNLLKVMKAWQGVKKLADCDLADYINKPALVTVEHNDSGEYANITAVAAPQKGLKIGKGFMSPVTCFLDDTFDAESFEALPEWIKTIIVDSTEYEEVSAPKGKKKAKR